MDRLEAMTILLRVVDRGGFSAASRDLGVPLATVSRKVSELEHHLGTRLLLRTTRKVSLTDTGAAYVAAVRRILDQIDETERIASGEFHAPRGELALTAPVLFGRRHILPIVTDFLALIGAGIDAPNLTAAPGCAPGGRSTIARPLASPA